tara:strand:+ start:2009 stop:2188 length:180 start_codon:yes stop_codon:yes gene_type:complete
MSNTKQSFEHTKELRNALRAEIKGYERGGPKPSVYAILTALNLIVTEGGSDNHSKTEGN